MEQPLGTVPERRAFAEVAARVSGHNIAARAISAISVMGGRHVMALLAGIVIARGLGPVGFGNFMFLLAGFTTLHTLLDLSTSQGFFTLICQKPWPPRMYAIYSGWIVAQLLLPLVTIGLLFPGTWIESIWRGQARDIVLLAFVASFAQRVFWQMVTQIYEASRLTFRIQLATIAIMTAHLGIVLVFKLAGILTMTTLFVALAAEFVVGGLVMLFLQHRRNYAGQASDTAREALHELFWYVLPLTPALFFSSANGFAETWLLQIFGGAAQQAFFNVAQQYANIGLVFGFSATNVFWKEIAAAHARRDESGLHRIYVNSTRVLFLAPALMAAFGIFWSHEVINFLLGPQYRNAAPVLSITFVTSIMQCVGIVPSAMFIATGRTKAWSYFTVAFVVLSLAGSVIFLAVLKLGAVGLALKLAFMITIFTLIYDRYISSSYGWKTDNLFRLAALGVLLLAGLASHLVVTALFPAAGTPARLGIGLAFYALLVLSPCFYIAQKMGYLSFLHRLFTART